MSALDALLGTTTTSPSKADSPPTSGSPSAAAGAAAAAAAEPKSDKGTKRSGNASSTMSALDALLGTDTAAEAEAEAAAEAAAASARAAASERATKSDEGTNSNNSNSAVARALTERGMSQQNPSTPNNTSTSAAGPNGQQPYDPEFDPLGLGPRWEVPWSWPTLVATLFAVEASFFLAGAIAPAVVYTAVREPGEIPMDDPELFAKDMQAVFDDPQSFANIVVVAEITQTVLALAVIAAAVAPSSP
eukprot:CAMPEP_0197608302 /NCGR_PEP_ID=MMETSP1326-20131121/48825_1 /TAXON_ID=1155430 /ORGANISM="Genus nov. species nov., Strain RCC2288" /LENGTH=246 /DNA_ID=CAMNT_0043176483 /DNA_START=16 /DNA_END=752 /DNA_ORIENTATION=-